MFLNELCIKNIEKFSDVFRALFRFSTSYEKRVKSLLHLDLILLGLSLDSSTRPRKLKRFIKKTQTPPNPYLRKKKRLPVPNYKKNTLFVINFDSQG